MTVLVTRPAPDCDATIARLAERGIHAIAAPAIEIRPLPDATLPAGCRALLITSANAIRAIAGRPGFPALTAIPVYTVGDRTADVARRAGFATVRSAGGDVDDLASLVRDEIAPDDGLLVHLSGRETAGDLTGALATGGYRTERRIVYETARPARLPDGAVAAIESGSVAAVLLYSPRSARNFADLVGESGLGGRLADTTAVVLSENIAEKAHAGGFGRVCVAEEPDETALVRALERSLKKSDR